MVQYLVKRLQMKITTLLYFALIFIFLTSACAQAKSYPPQPVLTPTASPTITPTPTRTQRVNPVCVDTHLNWLDNASIDKQLALMKQAGVKWTRFDFSR